MIDQSKPLTGAETKARILEAAADLFHEGGFEATGVATILRRAGAHSGSLYHFFPSKDALLVAVMERHLEDLRPTLLDPAERASSDPIDRVFALLELYRRNLRITDCTGGCPVGNLALEVGDRKPEVRVLIDEYFSRWVRRVGGWLEQAGDRLPADQDRMALARLVLSVAQGGVMQVRAGGEIAPYDDSVAQLRRLLALLADCAGRERQVARAPVAAAERARSVPTSARPAGEERGRETGLSPGAPHRGPVGEPGSNPEAEEGEPVLDRSAWRNW